MAVLLCGVMDQALEKVSWPWGWVVFPVMRLTVEGLVPGGEVGDDRGDCEWRTELGPTVASVSGATVCELWGEVGVWVLSEGAVEYEVVVGALTVCIGSSEVSPAV